MRFEIDIAHPTCLQSIPAAITARKRIRELAENSALQPIVAVNAADSCRSKHTSDPWSLFYNHGLRAHSGSLHTGRNAAGATTYYEYIYIIRLSLRSRVETHQYKGCSTRNNIEYMSHHSIYSSICFLYQNVRSSGHTGDRPACIPSLET